MKTSEDETCKPGLMTDAVSLLSLTSTSFLFPSGNSDLTFVFRTESEGENGEYYGHFLHLFSIMVKLRVRGVTISSLSLLTKRCWVSCKQLVNDTRSCQLLQYDPC